MALPANLERVERSHLEDLVDGGAAESRTLEFKRELNLSNGRAKTELVCDLSALANTEGGDVIYGMDEDGEGVASGLVGFTPANGVDELLRQATSALDAGVRPRIIGIGMRAVQLDEGKIALIVRMPRSRSKPHMVVREENFKFWKREQRGRSVMDVDELRSGFASTATLPERLRNLVTERARALTSEAFNPVQFLGKRGWLLHLVPIAALEGNPEVDIRRAFDGMQDLRGFVHGAQPFVNFDGIACVNPDRRVEDSTYVQLFRNGMVEAITSSVFQANMDVGTIRADTIADGVAMVESFTLLKETLSLWRSLRVQPPAYLTVTLIQSEGAYVRSTLPTHREFGFEPQAIPRNLLFLPNVAIEDYDLDDEALARAFAPIANALANAGGRFHSKYFTQAGDPTTKWWR